MDTKPFPFTSEFKSKVLALMLRDKSFIHKKRHILSHKYFENPAYAQVCSILLDFYDKYGITPTEDSLRQEIDKLEDNKLQKVILKKIETIDLSDGQYVIDEVTDFCTQQATRIALYLCEQYLKDKEYDKILPTMEKAMLSKDANVLDGMRLSDSLDIVKDYLNEENNNVNRIATLISGMDRILRGGVRAGEVNLVLAPTKRGKSILLNNFAYAAAMQAKKATYISLEMSNQANAVRSHMRLSGMSDNELMQREPKWRRAFNRLMSRGGDVYYKQFPTKQLNVKMLDTFLDKLQRVEGYSTDLLIVDYLDLMKPRRNYDSPWVGQGEIIEDLRGMIGDRGMACWTATQGQKDSGSKNMLGEQDVIGSSLKAFTTDSLWAILRSEEEMNAEPPVGRIKNILLREGEGMGACINVVFDPARMLVADADEIPF